MLFVFSEILYLFFESGPDCYSVSVFREELCKGDTPGASSEYSGVHRLTDPFSLIFLRIQIGIIVPNYNNTSQERFQGCMLNIMLILKECIVNKFKGEGKYLDFVR